MATSPPPQELSRHAFGLTESEVRRLQDILRREGSVNLTLEAAWARAIELLALFRMMLGPIPEDSRVDEFEHPRP